MSLGLTLRYLLSRLPVESLKNPPAVVPVVRLSGAIGMSRPLRPSLTLEGVAPLLERAFKTRLAKAVALVVNSPGGSPAQSSLICKRIRQLAEEHELPVHVFVEDVAASGGYWLALAGDDIHVDENSIIGSIGVVSAGFGFDRAIDKLGVQRRVYTIGENKSRLDPFKPEKPEDIEHLKTVQKRIHDNFIDLVRERRGDRLAEDEATLFSGDFWAARDAMELGLVDGIGDVRSVMRDRYGEDVKLIAMTPPRGLLRGRLPGLRAAGGAAMPGIDAGALVEQGLSALDERALWSRFGL